MDQIKIENLEIFAKSWGVSGRKTDWDRSFWFPAFCMWIHARREKTDDLEASVKLRNHFPSDKKKKMEEKKLQADRSSSRAACRRDLII